MKVETSSDKKRCAREKHATCANRHTKYRQVQTNPKEQMRNKGKKKKTKKTNTRRDAAPSQNGIMGKEKQDKASTRHQVPYYACCQHHGPVRTTTVPYHLVVLVGARRPPRPALPVHPPLAPGPELKVRRRRAHIDLRIRHGRAALGAVRVHCRGRGQSRLFQSKHQRIMECVTYTPAGETPAGRQTRAPAATPAGAPGHSP